MTTPTSPIPLNFLPSGASAPSSLFEQRLASSDPDSEVDIASAGTREDGKRCPVQSDFSPGRSSFWDQSPSLPPPGCPTTVTSVNAPLIPLATRLGAWLQLPSPSQWLIRTVRLGYAIQFTRCPPRYRGVLFTSVHSDTHAAVLRAEVAVLLAKDAIEPVPPAEMKSGFYSPYFIVPKKSGGLRPILDLRALNRHRPEGRVLSRLDSTSTQTLPTVCFRGSSVSVQSASIWPVPLSPCLYESHGSCLIPLWRMGIRILNYLDDWLLIAHSRDVLCEHRDLVLRHLSHLGLQVNREKSKLSPVQRISFLGVELDSVNMTARLTNERAQSVLNCLNSFRHKTAVPLKTFQRLLGHMAAAAAVTPLGLLHMRLLQHWLHDRVPRWAWHRGTLRIGVSLQCCRLFSPWSDPAFLQAGVPLGQVSRHLVVYTDASSTGWGAVCNGQAASDSWTGPQLQWHINCLELLAVLLVLRHFRPMLRHKHVLVRTDSTATVAYINHQGGLRSRRMSQLARHLLLWSQTWLKSLRTVHIPGELNRAADQLSRQSTHPGEWRLHPQRGSPRQGCAGTQLASGAQVRLSPSEPPCTDTVQDQGGRGTGSAGCAILAHPNLVSRPHFPCGSPSLEDPLEERRSFSGDGHNLALASRPMEPARLAPGRDASDLSGLSQAVIDTITQSRAPSTRQAYALRWGLLIDWCSSHGEDPQRCPIAVVLSFLQEKLKRRLSPSTLKVYVADIVAYHDAVDGASLGSTGSPQAFSVDEACLEFGPGYVPKVPTTPFRDQVVNLQALPLEEADPASALLCPVRALRIYVDRTRHFRRTEQLFVCFGGQQKGNAVSKQRLAHWVVDAISLSYQNQGEACPLGVRAHSTRSVASSYALAHGASLADICRAAGWATPNTFARFYNLRVEAVSSRVLT
ncbi:ORF V: Enzymatic polyprotein [Labeo rohita]|uniref:ribonuclease H n=1 Tax=Labeo rohita TaxID=84645 RepID=A0ABQ8LCV1_LABRO|nr:ORF V: Enzymatic polyprotein [Labeo rohita]